MPIEANASHPSRRRLRLGMVGGGRGAFIGGVHRMAARLDDRWEVVAAAPSSDPERARTSGEDLALSPDRVYRNAESMALAERQRGDGIDAVAIVTPNDSHAAIATEFLNAGIHVICDKPLTTSVPDADALVALTRKTGLIFVVTHNYTGYPAVRQARAMVLAGIIGCIRVVQVEYVQDWLSTRLEDSGHKQAMWRVDPKRSGPAGAVGDIGTHAFNLAEFVTADTVASVAADLNTFVKGRALDDNAQMLLRFTRGARGTLWCSQVAPGNNNALTLRVYGERGGLEWRQETPEALGLSMLGEPPRLIYRNSAGADSASRAASRIPAGHPEGYLEGFAQLYTDVAEQISARLEGRAPNPLSLQVPTVEEGLRGVRFIQAAVQSSTHDASWASV